MVETDKSNITETIKELMEINKIPKISLKDIKLKKKIGEGGQAKVYRGTYKDEEVAVKVLEEVDWKCLAHEIVIISNLHHVSIPKFYGIILEEGIIGLVNKYISGKPLDEYKISEFNEKQKVNIIKSLAHSLYYIHENKFIHRDLKPENIMIDNSFNFFLIDFGIAKVVTGQNNAYTRAKGTVHYLAPETLEVAELTETEEIVSAITTQVDVWAFGCIVSYIFSEKLPWCNKYLDNSTIIQKLLIKKSEFPVPVDLITKEKYANAELIIKLIKGSTVVDFTKRYTMKDVVAIVDQLK
jgi:eukaryotic-like serine/threonine-protein kinase